MKNQALFSSKDKSKNIKMSSAAILFSALRVKHSNPSTDLGNGPLVTKKQNRPKVLTQYYIHGSLV